MSEPTRLWFPRRTPLASVWRIDEGWHVFTHVADPHAIYTQVLGTGYILRNDGTAARTVWRPDGDEIMEVMK